MKIAVFVGSLHDASINKMLAKNLEALASERAEFVYANIQVPLYNQDLEANFPAEATALKELVESSDAVLLVTPEYNRGVPGVLKNAIDWASRPWGQNSFDAKPAGIVGASVAPQGTAQAQQQLRNVMVYLNTKLLGQPELYIFSSQAFDENGQVTDAARPALQAYIDAFLAHAEKNSK